MHLKELATQLETHLPEKFVHDLIEECSATHKIVSERYATLIASSLGAFTVINAKDFLQKDAEAAEKFIDWSHDITDELKKLLGVKRVT